VPRWNVLVAVTAALLLFPAGAAAIGGGGPGGDAETAQAGERSAEADFDLRSREALRSEPPPPSLGTARAGLRRALGRQGVLELDPITATPRFVGRLDGFLTEPTGRDPEEVALGFVRGNLGALGLDRGDVAALALTGRHTDAWGVTHLSWSQQVAGVPAFEAGLQAAVDDEGRLINLTGSPLPDLAVRDVGPELGAVGALAVAQRSGGESVALPPVSDREGGPERETEFGDGSEASLVLFARRAGDIDLSWRVVNVESSTEIYDTVVDASTGRVLRRENLVDFASGNVWEYFPNADQLLSEPADGGDGGGPRSLEAFPAAWQTEADALDGNFAHVYTDVDDDNDPEPGDEIAPNQAGPAWDHPFTEVAGSNCGSPFPACSWDSSTAFSWNGNAGQNGTQVYYFVNTFHDWLAAAPFGFTGAEAFEDADPVHVHVLDGAALDAGFPDEDHINNANMATFPGVDSAPRMQMYLFTELGSGSLPDVNGGDDASVVYHEYTHGLSNRLVNSGPGQPALNTFQSDSMGEGWSDWYAIDFLEANNIDEDDREGPGEDGEMNVGYYTFGGDVHTLRTMGLDCAAGSADPDCEDGQPDQAGTGGYTYGDMGGILCNASGSVCIPEVHADGEIWAQTLWDLRQRFRADYDPTDFADEHALGLDRVRALITEGMRLSPPNPSFLDMRNAILQANQVVPGDDESRIWSVFAARGMGYFAVSLGGDDTSPLEDFSTPPDCASGCGTVSGRVTETESGAPVAGATVEFLGQGNLVGTTDGNGNYSIANVPPHTYPYVASSAPGHQGELRANVSVGAGGATVNLTATRDWAALSGGASVTGFSPPDFTAFGCGPAAAFDLSLANGWGSTSPDGSPGGAKEVTVRLPQKVDVTAFAIDPGATCGDDDSASTRDYEVLTSVDGSSFTRASQGSFGPADNHRLNTIAPAAGAAGARFVRFVMRTPQVAVTAGADGVEFMDVSEVEVWGRAAVNPRITRLTALRRQRIRTLIAKGLRIRVGATEAVTLRGTMTIPGRFARRLGSPRRIGKATTSLRGAGAKVMTLRLGAKARRRIKAAESPLKRLPIVAAVRATDLGGVSAKRSIRVNLRR
jgi:hypothetical protein